MSTLFEVICIKLLSETILIYHFSSHQRVWKQSTILLTSVINVFWLPSTLPTHIQRTKLFSLIFIQQFLVALTFVTAEKLQKTIVTTVLDQVQNYVYMFVRIFYEDVTHVTFKRSRRSSPKLYDTSWCNLCPTSIYIDRKHILVLRYPLAYLLWCKKGSSKLLCHTLSYVHLYEQEESNVLYCFRFLPFLKTRFTLISEAWISVIDRVIYMVFDGNASSW